KPTHAPMRKRRSRQRLLDGAALSMHAIKDRNLAERGARRLKLVDGTNEERCLIPLIERLSDDDLRAVLALGEKTLRLAIDGFLDDRVGRAKNTRTRTIISLEFDARGLLKILPKIEDVAPIRPSPGVDALVVITDDDDISMSRGERTN